MGNRVASGEGRGSVRGGRPALVVAGRRGVQRKQQPGVREEAVQGGLKRILETPRREIVKDRDEKSAMAMDARGRTAWEADGWESWGGESRV